MMYQAKTDMDSQTFISGSICQWERWNTSSDTHPVHPWELLSCRYRDVAVTDHSSMFLRGIWVLYRYHKCIYWC